MNRAIDIGCRLVVMLGTALAVGAVYSPASGATAAAFIMLIDMWVSDIVSALKESNR